MAFAPNFDRNHRVYVDFTNLNGDTRVVQYRTFPGNRKRVNPATKRVLLKVGQPFDNHNGGQLQTGPDGLLYVSLGDGGSAGDPNLNGQSKGPLSTILRIDPRKPHPHAAMYAYGLRNPWRFSFDRATGGMWIGDVGQDTFEEVDHLRHGAPRAPTSAGASTRARACSRRSRSTGRSSVPRCGLPPRRLRRRQLLDHRRLRLPRRARSRASRASTSTPTSARAGSGRSRRAAAGRGSPT